MDILVEKAVNVNRIYDQKLVADDIFFKLRHAVKYFCPQNGNFEIGFCKSVLVELLGFYHLGKKIRHVFVESRVNGGGYRDIAGEIGE